MVPGFISIFGHLSGYRVIVLCAKTSILASGVNQDVNGVPDSIEVFARVTEDCLLVEVVVVDSGGNEIARENVDVDGPLNALNVDGEDVLTRGFKITIQTHGTIECDDELTVTLTCKDNPDCTVTETVRVSCKQRPGGDDGDCPDTNTISIDVTYNGQPVNLEADCMPTGDYSATANGALPGSVFFWTLEVGGVGVPGVPNTNPTNFSLPAGAEDATLNVIVMPPGDSGCDPASKTIVFPERWVGDCPDQVNVELRKDGVLIGPPYENLESGDYTLTVLSPVGADVTYTFWVDGVLVGFGPDESASFPVQGGGETTTVSVVATSGDCCPPVPLELDLVSSPDEEDVDEPEPVDPNPGGGDGGGDPGGGGPGDDNDDDDDDDENPWDFSLCGLLYALLMVAIGAFITTYIVSFSVFPLSAPFLAAAGIALVAVIALLTTMGALCSMSFCRSLRILTWMFFWTAIACLLAWIGSIFALAPLLIGVLVAGIITLILGLILQNRGCRFPNLFGWP